MHDAIMSRSFALCGTQVDNIDVDGLVNDCDPHVATHLTIDQKPEQITLSLYGKIDPFEAHNFFVHLSDLGFVEQ